MNDRLYKLMNWPEIEEIIYSDGNDPHRILGAHKVGNSILIQTFRPDLEEITVKASDKKSYKMELEDESGFFAALLPYKQDLTYHYEAVDKEGNKISFHDPYVFASTITREDCIRFNSGLHDTIYEKLGSHICERDGVKGVNFALWAPNAGRVSVVGDFNGHDGRINQMRKVDENGIFEIFIPDIGEGTSYQYECKTRGGDIFLRPDPYARKATDYTGEVSVVAPEYDYKWTDSSWMKQRKDYEKTVSALSICELTLDSFAQTCEEDGESTNYTHLADKVIRFVKSNGFNAIELLPVCEHDNEHKFDVNCFYAIKSEFGTEADFMAFVDRMHAEGIRVILDWTATYFPKRDYGMSYYDGHSLYEYDDPVKGTQPGTNRLIFDYGRKQVVNFLSANALFLLNKFHADGLRLTDVSKILYLDYDRKPGEWMPNIYGGYENLEAVDFLRDITSKVREFDPGVLLITKETACWPHLTDSVEEGGLGFDFKWNNGWSHDFLNYLRYDPILRGQHHNELTFSMMYSYTERFILAFSHEDIGGYPQLREMMPGDDAMKDAGVRMALAYMMVHPGRKMLFHGKHAVSMETGLELENFLYHLNMMYFNHPALYEQDDTADGFEWINSMAADLCMVAFARMGKRPEDDLLIVMNMAGVERELQIGVNRDGRYEEILNTDDTSFGGSGIVNDRKIEAALKECDGRNYSIPVHMAPLSLAVFSYIPYTEKEKQIRSIREQAHLKKLEEQEKNREELLTRHEQEEARVLAELKAKYEKELAEQQKAIEEKYDKIEEERIFAIVSDAALEKLGESGDKAPDAADKAKAPKSAASKTGSKTASKTGSKKTAKKAASTKPAKASGSSSSKAPAKKSTAKKNNSKK
ncbi:1,4-alpha-glucan branching enzyme [Butyrivibrio sp. MC2013]|uniref:1,4-alpha-glucan branching enzyme n=1 Tax=Butyrivibrio sp. MC2013 TaxID=1280686 RepID=UPI000408507C|nr:1,4-alpha-glucan branching enzyme [Butyrivibrio sp. MC2013]